ncbi:MAG: hypothetical protein ABIT04_10350 [Novosphingobium sp.]
MSALDPADMDRFGKLLGLLGSDHDGERASAAGKATEFLSRRRLGWYDIAEQLKRPPVVIPPRLEPSRSHQVDARRCLTSGVAWKPHELEFLSQMAAQLRRPTDKQRDWLDGLLDRVAAARRARAASQGGAGADF